MGAWGLGGFGGMEVWGLGFGGLGFRAFCFFVVQGSGFRVSGRRIWGVGERGLRISSFGSVEVLNPKPLAHWEGHAIDVETPMPRCVRVEGFGP